jgi:hypothetical protein
MRGALYPLGGVAILGMIVQAAAGDRPAVPPAKTSFERAVTLNAPGGERTTANIGFPDRGTRTVVFDPPLARSDGALYASALELLRALYGVERGLIQLKDARLIPEGALGNAVCWPIVNPPQQFCMLPAKDEQTGRMFAARVWTR